MTSNTPALELVTHKDGSYLREVTQLCPVCGATIEGADMIACQIEGGKKCIIHTLAETVDRANQ